MQHSGLPPSGATAPPRGDSRSPANAGGCLFATTRIVSADQARRARQADRDPGLLLQRGLVGLGLAITLTTAAATVAVASVRPAFAQPVVQEATPSPPPQPPPEPSAPAAPAAPAAPSADDIGASVADHLLGGLKEAVGAAITGWFENSAPLVLGRFVSLVFGAITTWLWTNIGGFLGSFNLWTQIPDDLTFGLPVLRTLEPRLVSLAHAILLLGLVLSLLWGGYRVCTGHPIGDLFRGAGSFLLCSGGLVFAPALMHWWVQFVNALAAAILDPAAGMPGLQQMDAISRLQAMGVLSIVFLVFGFAFLLGRLVLLLTTTVCLLVAPVAIAAGALPFSPLQRLFGWWLNLFLASTLVQVVQAGLLAIAASALTAALGAGGGGADQSSPQQTLLSGAIGIGAILASLKATGWLRAGLFSPGAMTLSGLRTVAGIGALAAGVMPLAAIARLRAAAYQVGAGAGAAGTPHAGSGAPAGVPAGVPAVTFTPLVPVPLPKALPPPQG